MGTDYIQRDPIHATGRVNVVIDAFGKPTYEFASDTAWDNLQWNELLDHLAIRTDAVCFGTLSQRSNLTRDTVLRFAKTTRPDCLRIFDVNLRQQFYNRTVIHESLQVASVLKLNDEELPVLSDMLSLPAGSEENQIRWLAKEYALRCVALTKGADGSVILFDDQLYYETPPPIAVVDTVGAGDAFTAALTVGLLNGDPIEQIHHEASKLAAFVCTKPGATPLNMIQK